MTAPRHFTPAHAGPPCPRCGLATVLALVNATGTYTHPACEEIA
jgi:hypothetical protein